MVFCRWFHTMVGGNVVTIFFFGCMSDGRAIIFIRIWSIRRGPMLRWFILGKSECMVVVFSSGFDSLVGWDIIIILFFSCGLFQRRSIKNVGGEMFVQFRNFGESTMIKLGIIIMFKMTSSNRIHIKFFFCLWFYRFMTVSCCRKNSRCLSLGKSEDMHITSMLSISYQILIIMFILTFNKRFFCDSSCSINNRGGYFVESHVFIQGGSWPSLIFSHFNLWIIFRFASKYDGMRVMGLLKSKELIDGDCWPSLIFSQFS